MSGEAWSGGRVPVDEEPDTCVFGCGGLLFGRVVGSRYWSSEERLAAILAAVNNHDALLAACKLAIKFWWTDHPNDTGEAMDALRAVEEAVAKAEGT